MVMPIIRDMNGRVIRDAEGPTAMDDPDVFDAFEEIERAFNDTMQRAFPRGGFTHIGGYIPPKIVENFIQHGRKVTPVGTAFTLNSTARIVLVQLPGSRTLIYSYSYEVISEAIVRCLDQLISITKEYHDAHAQASPANTEYEARRRALASVVPPPGARRLILGRAKGPEGGEG